MIRYFTTLTILFITLFGNIAEGNAQDNGLQFRLNPGQQLPASVIFNPRFQFTPTPQVNFGLLDFYDNGNVIPENQMDNVPPTYSNEILSARIVPSVVFSPETDGILRLIILSAIPNKVFEYDTNDLNLHPHFDNY